MIRHHLVSQDHTLTPTNYPKPVAGIVLAGGKGTRMKSRLPKVLHPLLGKPILQRVFDTLAAAEISNICLVLPDAYSDFHSFLAARPHLSACTQTLQRGTADAVAAALRLFSAASPPSYSQGRSIQGPILSDSYVLIGYGDTPAIPAAVLRAFIADAAAHDAELALIAMHCPDPFGYGRIITATDGSLLKIVEEKDASPSEREIKLCNSGIGFAKVSFLSELLSHVQPNNVQSEYYLTDCYEIAAKLGKPARVFTAERASDFLGINDQEQLAALEAHLLGEQRRRLQQAGVRLVLPASIYIEDSVFSAAEVVIEPGCVIRGQVNLGQGCHIGAHSFLEDATIGPGVYIAPGSVLRATK